MIWKSIIIQLRSSMSSRIRPTTMTQFPSYFIIRENLTHDCVRRKNPQIFYTSSDLRCLIILNKSWIILRSWKHHCHHWQRGQKVVLFFFTRVGWSWWSWTKGVASNWIFSAFFVLVFSRTAFERGPWDHCSNFCWDRVIQIWFFKITSFCFCSRREAVHALIRRWGSRNTTSRLVCHGLPSWWPREPGTRECRILRKYRSRPQYCFWRVRNRWVWCSRRVQSVHFLVWGWI